MIGYDHRFGKNRRALEALLANGPAYGFDVEEIPEQDIDHIAPAVQRSDPSSKQVAPRMLPTLLGDDHAITGRVIQGRQNWTYPRIHPTANLEVDPQHKPFQPMAYTQ